MNEQQIYHNNLHREGGLNLGDFDFEHVFESAVILTTGK